MKNFEFFARSMYILIAVLITKAPYELRMIWELVQLLFSSMSDMKAKHIIFQSDFVDSQALDLVQF